jgi:predicted permease
VRQPERHGTALLAVVLRTGNLSSPLAVLLWVWLVGLHWTAIGVAVYCAVVVIAATAYTIGRSGFDA